MKEKLLLSIIIPAYNAETVIEKTLSSIPRATIFDIQVIVIDDGSTDKTRDIVSQYIYRSGQNIQIITTENMGPADARNTGIDNATGEFVLFLDADDTFDPLIFDTISSALDVAPHVDLLIFGFRIINSSGSIVNTYRHTPLDLTVDTIGQRFSELYQSNLLNQVWNKVYRRTLIQSVRFQDLMYGEDRIFVLDSLKLADNISILDDVLYDYRITGTDSLISKFYPKKLTATLRIDESVRDYAHKVEATSPRDIQIYDYMLLKGIVSCMTNVFAKSCPYEKTARKHAIKEILQNSRVVELANSARLQSLYLNIVVRTLKTGLIMPNYMLAKSIYALNTATPRLFTKIKHVKKA